MNDLASCHHCKKLIEVLGDVYEFYVHHDIEYYVYVGAALGAVRHGGGIPWDDDIDVIMTQENFANLCVWTGKFAVQVLMCKEILESISK